MADNNTTFDDSIPVTFTLPDGDQAKLITWAFVMKKLTPTIEQLSATNAALTRINARVDEWLEEQS